MTSPVGLCAIVMVTNVISQHAAQVFFLFNTLLKRSEQSVTISYGTHSKHAIPRKKIHHSNSNIFLSLSSAEESVFHELQCNLNGFIKLRLVDSLRHARSTIAILLILFHNFAVTKPQDRYRELIFRPEVRENRSVWKSTKLAMARQQCSRYLDLRGGEIVKGNFESFRALLSLAWLTDQLLQTR